MLHRGLSCRNSDHWWCDNSAQRTRCWSLLWPTTANLENHYSKEGSILIQFLFKRNHFWHPWKHSVIYSLTWCYWHGQNIIRHKERVFNRQYCRLYSRLPRPIDHRCNTVNCTRAVALCTNGLWDIRSSSLQIPNQQQANQHRNKCLDLTSDIFHNQRVASVSTHWIPFVSGNKMQRGFGWTLATYPNWFVSWIF